MPKPWNMTLNKGIWDPKPRLTNIKGTNLKSLGCSKCSVSILALSLSLSLSLSLHLRAYYWELFRLLEKSDGFEVLGYGHWGSAIQPLAGCYSTLVNDSPNQIFKPPLVPLSRAIWPLELWLHDSYTTQE